jgi:hypothetical protein
MRRAEIRRQAESEVQMFRRYWKVGVVALSCLGVGAGASVIANAGAATGGNGASATAKQHRGGGGHGLLGRAVHGDLVVPTKSGFVTVTLDRGIVKALSGQQITLTEGTKTATYKTVTLTIPPNAHVRVNRHKATLADVKPGQRAVIVKGQNNTLVAARG